MAMRKLHASLLITLGIGLEYYDFVIYGLLASFISQLFFPSDDKTVAFIKTLAVFAIGYLGRPIGGVLFGILGDRFGRKITFLSAMLLMAFSTLAIGCLPTYEAWGSIATFCLVSLRIIQGMAFGAELPGAATFLTEYVENNRRGFHNGFLSSSMSIAAIFGSISVYVLTTYFTEQQILAFGWRLPFLFGGILAILSFLIRKQLQETPYFLNAEKHKTTLGPFFELIRDYPLSLLQGIGITLFGACFVIFAITMPSFLHEFFGYSLTDTNLANTFVLIFSMLATPFCGLLSDQIGRKKMMLITTSIFIFTIFFLFNLLQQKTFFALMSFMLLYQVFICLFIVCYLTLLTEIFPTRVRYSGVAISYNIAFCLAGFTPSIMTYLLTQINNIQIISVTFVVLALITAFSVKKVRIAPKQELL